MERQFVPKDLEGKLIIKLRGSIGLITSEIKYRAVKENAKTL